MTNETIADIIAEMRALSNPISDGIIAINGRIIADRLEAANKREVRELRQQRDLWSKRAAELVEKCNEQYAKLKQVGNAAKLREALKQVNELNDLWFDTFSFPDGATSIHDEIENVISAALAATEQEGGTDGNE